MTLKLAEMSVVKSQSRTGLIFIFIITELVHFALVFLYTTAGVWNTDAAFSSGSENAWGEWAEEKTWHHDDIRVQGWLETRRADCPRVWRVRMLYINTAVSGHSMQPLDGKAWQTRAMFGDRAFSVAGLTVWNSMPESVRSAETLASFKHKLKTYLFSILF